MLLRVPDELVEVAERVRRGSNESVACAGRSGAAFDHDDHADHPRDSAEEGGFERERLVAGAHPRCDERGDDGHRSEAGRVRVELEQQPEAHGDRGEDDRADGKQAGDRVGRGVAVAVRLVDGLTSGPLLSKRAASRARAVASSSRVCRPEAGPRAGPTAC